MICPACRRESKDGVMECSACGVIFAKWKGPAVSTVTQSGTDAPEGSPENVAGADAVEAVADPAATDTQPAVTLLKPCPACGRELAGTFIMEQLCPYCSTMLPRGFDPRPAPPPPRPPLPPTQQELEFEALPLWKKLWLHRPWWVFWGSVCLLAVHEVVFCLGGSLAGIPVFLYPTLVAMTPTLLISVCPQHGLDGLVLLVFCVAALRKGLLATWERSPAMAIFYGTIVVLAVMVSNLLLAVRGGV